MVAETRTILKNFNRDLLIEELAASALPFIQADFSGFKRIDQYVGAPVIESRLILRKRNNDGTYLEDFAQPGEIRFEFSTALTAAEATALDSLLSAHDATQFTTEQTRENQDITDMDTLVDNYPNFDSFNNAQFRKFVKTLARVVIREHRTPPI